MTHVSVVIVTYNSSIDIVGCVDSIRAATSARPSIHIVDNDSRDDTVGIIEALENDGKIDSWIASPENVGFSAAVNRILGLAEGHVLLFNPDARMHAGALDLLVAYLRDHPRVGIVSPLVYSDGSVATTTAGRQPRLWPMFAHFSGLSRSLRHQRWKWPEGRYLYLDEVQGGDPREVEWVAGCAMLIREETRRQFPQLTERYFMYAEDTHYCQQVRKAGWGVHILPEAQCYHEMGVSVTDDSFGPPVVRTWWPENLTDYYREEFRPSALTFAVWKLVFSGGLLSRAAVFALRSRKSDDPHARREARRFKVFAKAVWRST